MRTVISLVSTAAAAIAMAVVFAIPARAAATYTWSGASDHEWSNAGNWSPNGVPSTGDSVVVGSLPGGPSDIEDIPTVSLASLTIDETANNIYLNGSYLSTITVTGAFSWSGGAISVPITIAAGATGLITGMSAFTHANTFGGGSPLASQTMRLTVKGSLTIAGIGVGSTLPPTLGLSGRDDLVVAPGGILITTGTTLIQSDSCCVDHTSTLENSGTVSATGTLQLQYLGLDQNGSFVVPAGKRTQLLSGPMRSQGSTAVFSGGGTFEVVRTDGVNYDPAHPDAPEATWKLGWTGTTTHPATVTLAGGTVLQLDKGAYLNGVGTITGVGTLRMSGGHLEARLSVNVPLQSTASVTTTVDKISHVDAWTTTIVGEYGEVTLHKASSLAAGSSLQIEGRDTLTLASGSSLSVPGNAGITSGGCCVNPAKVTVNSGATMTLGSASGTALLQWIALAGGGHLVLAGPSQWNGLPSVLFGGTALITGHALVTGTFSTYHPTFVPGSAFVVHGAAVLAGTLVTNTPFTATGAVTVGGTLKSSSGTAATVAGSSITGHYACAYTPGRIPVYGATKVTLVSIGVTDSGCLIYAAGTRLNGTFSGSHAFSVSLPSTAKRALLKVTVSAASAATTLKITATGGGSAAITVPKTTATTEYVIVALGPAHTFTATLGTGAAKVAIVQAGSYH